MESEFYWSLRDSSQYLIQSAGAIEYTDWISSEGLDSSYNEYPGYYIIQCDGHVPAFELLGMYNPSLSSLPGPLWPRMVASDRVLSTGQIGQTMWNKWLMLNRD